MTTIKQTNITLVKQSTFDCLVAVKQLNQIAWKQSNICPMGQPNLFALNCPTLNCGIVKLIAAKQFRFFAMK